MDIAKRRQTLGILDMANQQNMANFHSGIPVPASAYKQKPSMTTAPPSAQRGSRPSLLGLPRLNKNGNGNSNGPMVDGAQSYPPPGTVQRHGPSDRLNMRQSTIGGVTPANRLSNTYNMRVSNANLLASVSRSSFQQDPRPLRDKGFQNNCIRTIMDYLAHAGYKQPISTKVLQAPTNKDFQNLFRFLTNQLDPCYTFAKKFEEEVIGVMKALRYPFVDQFNKTQVYAAGAPNSWPVMLGMLAWMVDLIVSLDKIEAELPEYQDEVDANNENKLFYEYLSKAYSVWLRGGDDFEPMEQELEASFERKNEYTQQEVNRLLQENEALLAELKALEEVEAPLVAAENDRTTLLRDKEKFVVYLEHQEGKKRRLIEQNESMKVELAKIETELGKFTKEKAELQAIVDGQDISLADMDRMTSEREQLAKSLEIINAKVEEVNALAWKREMDIQKKMDMVEKAIQEYNSLAYKINLIPSTSSYANGINFEIDFNLHASKPEQMLSVDVKNVVRPALQDLRCNFNTQLHQVQNETLQLQETLESLNEQISEKVDELDQTETRIRKLSDQYNEEREMISRENTAYNTQSETIEREVNRMRMDGQAVLLHSSQRLQKVKIEYDQLVAKATTLKEKAGEEIIQVLEYLINLKSHIENSFIELGRLVEEDQQNADGHEIESILVN